MKILSHRGFHRGSPLYENTHAAFERAIDHGVDGIETDIRLSADSQAILFHDRLAPDHRPVESLSRRQLEELTKHEIPTLEEILSRWPNVLWNLEVKCPAAAPVTFDLVKQHSRPDKIIVTSFRHDTLAQWAPQNDVACGLLLAHYPIDVSSILEPWRKLPHVRTIVWDFNIIGPQAVAQAQQLGYRVWVYGALTPNDRTLCEDLTLDAIITDDPTLSKG